jgi:hypothetical protein
MSSENPFEENLSDPYQGFLEEAGIGSRGKQEAKKPEVTKKYVGRTQWKVVVSGSPSDRGWLPGKSLSVGRSGESQSVREMLDPKAAEREAESMEKFAQSIALAIMRASDRDLSKAAETARSLSAMAEAYKNGATVLDGGTVADLDENKPGRADWALGKIESAIKKHGRSEVADILALLAQVFSRE